MVKGITKQVVVVKGSDPGLFEQAIFLVRESALTKGGITEEALLQEAKQVCRSAGRPLTLLQKLLWSGFGAAATGLLWAMVSIL